MRRTFWRDPLEQSIGVFTDLDRLVASPANKWGAVLLNRSTYEVIGRAAHDGTRWVFGDLDLTKVSTTPYAVVASVDDGTTCTLTGGHNLTTGTVRLWDTSAGASLGDVAGVVAGNTLTVPDTTGMTAGDQVWRTGVSEVAIDTGEVIALGAAATGKFTYAAGVSFGAGPVTYGHGYTAAVVATPVGTETFTTLSADGYLLGSEIFHDPDMEQVGTAGYSLEGATVTKIADPYTGTQSTRVEKTGASNPSVTVAVSTAKSYRVEAVAKSGGFSIVQVWNSPYTWAVVESPSWRRLVAIVDTPTSSPLKISAQGVGVIGDAWILGALSVRRVLV